MIFADLEVARRLERTEAEAGVRFVEARARLSPEAGAQWMEIAGVHAMFDGPDSPVTQTFGLGLFAETTPEALDRLEAFFHERGAPVIHEVSPLAGIPLAEMLSRRGYVPVEYTSVMFKPTGTVCDSPRLPTRCMAAGEEDLWSRVSVQGWAVQAELMELMQNFGRVVASADGLLCFFAYVDGEPVATGALRCHEGVGLFAGASTIPEARNRGAQRALLEVRTKVAAELGCDLLMMCTEPGSASQRNAEREGFRIAYTRTKWRLSWTALPRHAMLKTS